MLAWRTISGALLLARFIARLTAQLPVLLTAIALVVCALELSPSALAQTAASDKLLAEVLADVAAKPLVATPFFERRTSTLFAKPLESRGTLTYKPPSALEKLTTSPIRERVTLTVDTMTIQSGDAAAKVIKLDAQPSMLAFSSAVRAVLAGDVKPIAQYFNAAMTGSRAQWTLVLDPKDPALKRVIKQVVVKGQHGQVTLIETTELGGDVNELTLLAVGEASKR